MFMSKKSATPPPVSQGSEPHENPAASDPAMEARVSVRALRVFTIGGCTVSPGKEFQTAKSIADKMVAAGDAVILGTVY